MANQQKLLLTSILKEKDEEFRGDNSILNWSSLTFPFMMDSARTIMDVNHQMQRVVMDNTEFPFVFNNSENMFGHRSTYNIVAESDLEIHKVIPKFNGLDIDSATQPALIIYFDRETSKYDVMYKQDVQNLPEKYGFQYDHSFLDNVKEGGFIPKGTSLTRPTSYDDFDNYG